MTKFLTFLLNPQTLIAVVLALISFLSISSPAFVASTPQLLAGIVLIAAVLLLVLAAFQSGRLPRPSADDFSSGSGAGGNRMTARDVEDQANITHVDFGQPRTSMTWPYVRTRLSEGYGGLPALIGLTRRREEYSPA